MGGGICVWAQVVYLSPVGVCASKWVFCLELRSLRPLKIGEIPGKSRKFQSKKGQDKDGPSPFLPLSCPHIHWIFTNSQEVVGRSEAAVDVGGACSPETTG